jgi:predicted ABC-type ATPase
MARPRMIVVAGPPGSGKTRSFPASAFGVDGFNIDDRCAQILGSYRAIPREVRGAVAKECERFVLAHIEHGRSFAVETTLRTTAAIDQAVLAQRNGFIADMHFVATDSIDENVARVIQRAQAGGHGASEREIRAIHHASIANLATAICVVRPRSHLRLDRQVVTASARRRRTHRPCHPPWSCPRMAQRGAPE